jgi:hypothetical protein
MKKAKTNIKQIIFNSVLTFTLLTSTGTMVYAASTSTPITYNGVTAYGVLSVDWLSNGGKGYAKTYTNDDTTYSLGAYLTVHNTSGAAINGDTAVGFDSVQTKVLQETEAAEYRSLHNIQLNRVPQVQAKLVVDP